MLAMALGLSIIENFIPSPSELLGTRLGLSNIIILTLLVSVGFKEALLIGVLKSLLRMLVTGSVTGFVYSLAGSIVSTLAMKLALKLPEDKFSLIGISMIGASLHNVSQLAVLSLMTRNIRLFSYLPVLIFTAIFTGYFVGLCSNYLTKHLKRVAVEFKKGDSNARKKRRC